MTQQPSAGVRLKLILTALSQLTSSGVMTVVVLSKTIVPMLIAKSADSPGLMILHTWILKIKILTQNAGVSRKDNLLQTTIMVMLAAV